MPSTLTRKQILQSAAQRVGNAAAHLAVYDDPSKRLMSLSEKKCAIESTHYGWRPCGTVV